MASTKIAGVTGVRRPPSPVCLFMFVVSHFPPRADSRAALLYHAPSLQRPGAGYRLSASRVRPEIRDPHVRFTSRTTTQKKSSLPDLAKIGGSPTTKGESQHAIQVASSTGPGRRCRRGRAAGVDARGDPRKKKTPTKNTTPPARPPEKPIAKKHFPAGPWGGQTQTLP